MTYFNLSKVILISLLISSNGVVNAQRLQYFPEGRCFVCHDGNNRFTRALYGGHTEFRLETSDRPVFATFSKQTKRNIQFLLKFADGTVKNLDSIDGCTAYYDAGKRSYTIINKQLGLNLSIEALCCYDADEALWTFNFRSMPKGAKIVAKVSMIKAKKLSRSGDMGADPKGCFEASSEEPLLVKELDLQKTMYIKYKDGIVAPMNASEGKLLYQKTEAQRKTVTGSLVINTPDPYFNTLGGTISAAADGIWDNKVWLHGAIGWRVQLPGWRAGYTGDCLGWHDKARTHFNNYAESMVTNIEPKYNHPAQDQKNALARAEKKWGTPMYSNGYIARYPNSPKQMNHYDMNLCYIDELLWHLNWTGDTAYAKKMWPYIKLHLAWEKRNFDPDNDCLYDAYACIWASDGLYYNSGAVTHSSAYNYRANYIAAQIAELIGEDAEPYRKEAEGILKAINNELWLSDKGVWAEFKDFMGLKRLHTVPAVWTIYHSIDSDIANPFQAYKAMDYVTNEIPHVDIKSDGTTPQDSLINSENFATIATSNWMPYDWSINNVAFAEVMHTALAYFEAGNKEEGYRLMKSSMLDGMYMGASPGNIGQISYYDAARGECYRDFGDPIGVASRLVVQGLYGINPDALHHKLNIKPGIPASWPFADIKTADVEYSYKQKGTSDIYILKHNIQNIDTIALTVPLRYDRFELKAGCRIVDFKREGYSINEPSATIKLIVPKDKKVSFEIRGTGNAVSESLAQNVDHSTYGFTKYRQGDVWWWKFDGKAKLDRTSHQDFNSFDEIDTQALEPVCIDDAFNSKVTDIFENKYLEPRSPYTTLELPVQGYSEWCIPLATKKINDSGLRNAITDGLYTIKGGKLDGLKWLSPKAGNNIAYTSLFKNYPDEISVKASGKATHAYLMMAGSTNPMQCNIDNARLTFEYKDGTKQVYALQSPSNWAPIEQAFYEDGKAFNRHTEALYRLCLKNGKVSNNLQKELGVKNAQVMIDGGAGIILDVRLNGSKELKKITLRTLSNDVVVGLMGVTLQR